MQPTELLKQIRQLPPEDRLSLMNQLWAELSQIDSLAPLTEAQRRILDERLDAHLADPSSTTPWDQARDQVLGDL